MCKEYKCENSKDTRQTLWVFLLKASLKAQTCLTVGGGKNGKDEENIIFSPSTPFYKDTCGVSQNFVASSYGVYFH